MEDVVGAMSGVEALAHDHEALLLHLRRLLDELRERLEEEEREVFPVLETAELRNRRVTW